MNPEELSVQIRRELEEIRDLDLTPEVEESLIESRPHYEEIAGEKLTLREVYNISFDKTEETNS